MRFLKFTFISARPYQWVKNLLIFLPLILSNAFSFDNIISSIIGFIVFSFITSSGYIINDINDVEIDKMHPRKKNRPFASDNISKKNCYIICLILFGLASIISIFFISLNYWFIILFYFVLSCYYSIFLKTIIVLDIFILAFLYTLRIIAGGSILDIEITKWLLYFSMFFFLSIAAQKRFIEVNFNNKDNILVKGYQKNDNFNLKTISIVSGYISILILAIYFNSNEIAPIFLNSKVSLLYPFLICFWLTRFYFYSNREPINDDPITFILKDVISWSIIIIVFLLVFIDIYY